MLATENVGRTTKQKKLRECAVTGSCYSTLANRRTGNAAATRTWPRCETPEGPSFDWVSRRIRLSAGCGFPQTEALSLGAAEQVKQLYLLSGFKALGIRAGTS